ncbi:CHASE3 domain-containing protein [Cupriavidus basilensis]|uniref:CHASE3 domain-containing protein n=1 Tax=Cupriavidus basilensis TaxID=68895 RepID=UPI0023E81FFE|nr:Tar ligand binding domain-containing protein [Cupriavidus basilensis]MDF3883447.1 MCP four helix bundle domain-containing protein [Cupriavidus basilensis]
MNITQRLLATLSLALFAILALGIGGIWQLRASQERFSYFNDNTLVSVRTLDDLWADVNGMRVSLYAYALSDEASGRAEALAALAKADQASIRTWLPMSAAISPTRRTGRCWTPTGPR